MTLKIELKPFERLRIGSDCTLTNNERRIIFGIDGTTMVLRDSQCIRKSDIHNSLSFIYFVTQELGLKGQLLPIELWDSAISSIEALTRDEERAVLAARASIEKGHVFNALNILKKGMEYCYGTGLPIR